MIRQIYRTLCLLGCVFVLAFGPSRLTGQESPRITVSGDALVQVTPDKVTIVLGIETWDRDINLAKQQNNEILQRATDEIRQAGVRDVDIQTDHLSIAPRYDDGYRREDFIGYFVRNSLSVTLLDPDALEGLITGVLAAGVTHIHGVNFETTEFKVHREAARRMALEAAREKAGKMAAVLGMEVGDPVSINENRQYGGWSYGGWWGYNRGQAMSQNVMQNASGQGGDVSDTVALGKISIRAGVTVIFELR